jgi:hypothetical protein
MAFNANCLVLGDAIMVLHFVYGGYLWRSGFVVLAACWPINFRLISKIKKHYLIGYLLYQWRYTPYHIGIKSIFGAVMFKITEEVKGDNCKQVFTFHAISDSDGICLTLFDYRLTTVADGRAISKRWNLVGNDGTFVKRHRIEIPATVIAAAKAKLASSITFA